MEDDKPFVPKVAAIGDQATAMNEDEDMATHAWLDDDRLSSEKRRRSRIYADLPVMEVWLARRAEPRKGKPDRWTRVVVERLPDGTPGRTFLTAKDQVSVTSDMPARKAAWSLAVPSSPPSEEDLREREGPDPMTANEAMAIATWKGATFLVRWNGTGLSGHVAVCALDEGSRAICGPRRVLCDGDPLRVKVARSLPALASACVGKWFLESDAYRDLPFCVKEARSLGWGNRRPVASRLPAHTVTVKDRSAEDAVQ